MRTMMLMENIATPIVNKLVETIFDLSEASIARGAYSGYENLFLCLLSRVYKAS